MRKLHSHLPVLFVLFVVSLRVHAQSNLSTTDTPVLHLEAATLSHLGDGARIMTWESIVSSTNAFTQPLIEARPTLKKVGDACVVRFDGVGQQLRSLANEQTTEDLTLFVVAAAHSNYGSFRGFLSTNKNDQRDYTSGFCIDLGPRATQKLDWVNVEGIGFTTAKDLSDQSYDFPALRVFTVHISQQDQKVTLRIDGKPTGSREYTSSPISLEEWTLGARYVSEGPGEKPISNTLEGDIAEVICFTTALDDTSMAKIESQLLTKYKSLADELPKSLPKDTSLVILQKVKEPASVQMLVPGYSIYEIPVELTNVNNVRYRHDGKLITLGYNGDVHVLSDSNGDGLEDHVELFYKNDGSLRGPIGMALTPKGYSRGQGVFTPSKGKLSFIVDKDGDDKADEEQVIASGWNEITQSVDATGVAMDSEGNLLFGLGTADYANAYLLDDKGKAQYDIASDRGTVQKLSADFTKRETVCTGIRFPIAFAFNQLGDLFCSEQEGATWLANGNPFDELLHIIPEKHYGFPPRHPRHNPNVIDEPSVFDYGPQHQSTCGMVFNHSVNGGPVFGPAWWENDAILCGESRGKIWRTQLTKTEFGYIAQSQLLACLQMLTVDACVAPNGDLVVACHSGPPDWGTGPTGLGKLFRIRRVDQEMPTPSNVWPNSSQEIAIAFDRPISPESLQGVRDNLFIHYGEYVRAGDEFETLSPPYAVVQRQSRSPRRQLGVFGLSLSNDRRVLLLQTEKMSRNATYAISLPWRQEEAQQDARALKTSNVLDVDMTLDGVTAKVFASSIDRGAEPTWQGWLPHIDSSVNDEFTRHSRLHDEYRDALKNAKAIELASRLDLSNILRPLVQPGSSIDYEWPTEEVSLLVKSNSKFELLVSSQTLTSKLNSTNEYELTYAVPVDQAKELDVLLRIAVTSGSPLKCSVAVATNEDATLRAIPLRRFKLPWSSKEEDADVPGNTMVAELEGGSWGRGRRVYHSEAASCFKCHAIHGGGSRIGPDLTNLVHRDYASVLRDIVNPSFAINPDHLGQVILTKDDQILTGVLRTENGRLILGDSNGNSQIIARDNIEEMKSAEVSIMPKGLDERLTKEQLRDLMTFLLKKPPQMPLDSPLTAPPVRTQAEVAAVLEGSQPLPQTLDSLNVLLVAGQKDHGPGEHDYPAWQRQWAQLLSAAPNVTIDLANDFPNDDQLQQSDVMIFFQKGTWNDDRQQKMDEYFERGKGAVYIHWAVNGEERVVDFASRIGLASRGGNIRYRHGPLTLDVHNTDHPIMRNIETMQLYDESYWLLAGNPKNVTLFASSMEDGEATPQLWSYERGTGRVFVSIPGHYSWTFDDPIFRTVLLRGIAWTARQPIDRFNELVPLGARISK